MNGSTPALETQSDATLRDMQAQEKRYLRRIFAEDPEWNILSVKKLTDLCLDVLVANFESNLKF